MFTKHSRYLDARRFEPGENGSLPFRGVRPRQIGAATPVLEHALQPGERFDALGGHYFNDPWRWHRILDANPDVLCAAQLEIIGLPQLPRPSGEALPGTDEDSDHGEILLIPQVRENG